MASEISAQAWDAFLGYFVDKTSAYATPGELAKALDHRTVQTPALDLIDAALVDVAERRCDRLIISMPPQEGKVSGHPGDARHGCWSATRTPVSRSPRMSMGSLDAGVGRSATTSRPTRSWGFRCVRTRRPRTSGNWTGPRGACTASAWVVR